MPPELVSVTDGAHILLDKPILLLGRHQECDIQLNSRKVSRRHCCIAQVSDYLVIRDLDSTNGIRINGVKTREGKLRPGDELTIGHFLYRIRWPGHPADPLPPGNGSHSKAAMARGVATEPEEDEELESCEEPVPLSDPVVDSPIPEVQVAAPVSPPVAGEGRGEEDATERKDEPSLILPDNLRLAPSSDIRRNKD
jgi:predicted component of type VI protein secretion system